MPDMDSPKISAAILEDRAASSSTVKSLHLSKRPREETSPVPGKRGRGENGDLVPVQVPQAPANLTVGVIYGNATQNFLPSSPLLESPSKVNRAPRGTTAATFAPFPEEENTIKAAVKMDADAEDVRPVRGMPGRRKVFPFAPPAARSSVAATDPVFHAALLRLLQRREASGQGRASQESLDWRWNGDTPGRFDHWPRGLHPDLMDLLACVSASEERVVLTGCDSKDSSAAHFENPLSPHQHHYRHHQQSSSQLRGECSPWRAQRWRSQGPRRSPSAMNEPLAATATGATTAASATASAAAAESTRTSSNSPEAMTPAPRARALTPSATPSSALRRPGGSRRPLNRVRFSTHDMSVVDTPDPGRDGSEKGMVSALGGLQSILIAAEKVRNTAIPSLRDDGTTDHLVTGSVVDPARLRRRSPEFEGYFDRFSSTGGRQEDEGGEVVEEMNAEVAAGNVVTPDSSAEEEQDDAEHASSAQNGQVGDGGSSSVVASDTSPSEVSGPAVLEGNGSLHLDEVKQVRRDVVHLVDVLHEMASCDSAPGELTVRGGWGPEHSSATAFYARELAILCGTEAVTRATEVEVGERMRREPSGASQLRVRYLDVLSCLVRYNLKILMNTCSCEVPEPEEETVTFPGAEFLEDFVGEPKDDIDVDLEVAEDASSTSSLGSPAMSTGLRVIVPGRVEDGSCEANPATSSLVLSNGTASKESGGIPEACGAVAVVPGTGALEFNAEDVAALLTLALRRVYPFMRLAMRLAVVAEEAGWADEDEDEDALDDRVWSMVQAFVVESRSSHAESLAGPEEAEKTVNGSIGNESGMVKGAGVCGSAGLFVVTRASTLPENPDQAVVDGSGSGPLPMDSGPGVLSALRMGSDVGSSTDDSDSCTNAGDRNGASLGESTCSDGLTVDEALDLLEYVAAARFIAHLLSEPVVASGIASGRWAHAEYLARQVQMLAEAEEESAVAATAMSSPGSERVDIPLGSVASFGDMLCLGELADVQRLAMTMSQQARFAPALEAVLRSELRRAMKRGQGRQRRLKSRLHALQGMPGVMSFPLVRPGCCLLL